MPDGRAEQRSVFGTLKNVGQGRRNLPKELMCYLSDDAPPLKGRKVIDLGMTLARMHYKVGSQQSPDRRLLGRSSHPTLTLPQIVSNSLA